MTRNASRRVPPTRAPRWTERATDAHGTGAHRARIPEDLAAGLRGTAARLGADLAALLLAAHARVLATVTAERELNTGQVRAAGTSPAALRLTVADSTWGELVARASALESEPREPGSSAEIVCDLSGLEGPGPETDELGDGTLVRVAFAADGAGLSLRVLFDRATLNEEYAARLTGYHLTALRLLAADPEAPHHRQSLLSPAETETQLHGLSGPRAAPPTGTFVDAFEERVRDAPGRVAAAHGADQWTYGELNARANQYAHALLAAGTRPEDVVAVVMDRGLDWIAAALGVFKAGGVYLPVHPDFPAERIAGQLGRSACRSALVAPDAEARVREAAAGLDQPPRVLGTAHAARADTENPGLAIDPGQAAYIYFTSGSTGAPKGAVCEHAGLLNHLHMKIEDMGMATGGGEVTAQTAAQFVDISLWQFAAPLLVGGSARVVDTDTLLDVDRFLDEIARGAVTVAQVVPSYLEVLLAHVERHPRPLGDLRALSVTGETLRLESARRWFRAYPHIRLVNSYGATEVSDDTMHEVLYGPPDGESVPVGRPLRNVNAYVLDENLALAPLGTPGEIAFSGVCVGRGYINDEERTRQAFVPDPFRADTRMYRTGDFGRWLPEGRVEYLGRRDEQVKIRGFRIEVGEIENRLLAIAGVRDAAVVVEDAAGGGPRNLVAFFAGGEELTAGRVRDALAGSLPDYMVPTYVHRLRRLPLTENGKVDKKALVRLAGTLGHGGAPYVAPRTPTEQRLATLWAEVLNTPLERIGRDDDFFELGGSSLAGVRLVVRMDRELSLKQLVRYPVLSSLAAALDGTPPDDGGDGPLTDGLLQPLSRVEAAHHSLVCFPYAGGNAVNFRALAAELERDGIAVYGVEPPGHDLVDDGEPPADVAELARRVHAEIVARIDAPVLLWGHGEGAAAALETARLLEAGGRRAERVFIGALLLAEADDLRRTMREVAAADHRTLLARLRAESAYVELDGLKPERAEVVGSAYRHDVLTSHHHLIAVRENAERYGIGSAVDVVVAQDDATTSEFGERHGEWKLVADTVRLRELAGGGRYFVRASPADSAALVRAACERPRRTPV
ncbi:amino acid adenylation domain-containing protein [Streptomyces varsoviensis]|uniref:non-ribosomal peptide synthetase family protein n=1 Tax=Streptomyces varsoviensis TaxID=67373 RepID=UPI0033C03186